MPFTYAPWNTDPIMTHPMDPMPVCCIVHPGPICSFCGGCCDGCPPSLCVAKCPPVCAPICAMCPPSLGCCVECKCIQLCIPNCQSPCVKLCEPCNKCMDCNPDCMVSCCNCSLC